MEQKFKSVNLSGRNNSKDFIVKTVFKLLLEYNFEKVTVPLIEKTGNLNRGGIFYHFKDKENIFQAVIDVYFFSWLNFFSPVLIEKDLQSISDYIDIRKKNIEEVQQWFFKEKIQVNPINGFLHLASQADKYYTNFQDKFDRLIEEDRKSWEIAIKKSKQTPLFLSNIGIKEFVNLLRHCFYGELLDSVYSSKFYFNSSAKLSNLFEKGL